MTPIQLQPFFPIAGPLVAALAFLVYLRQTIAGKVRPRVATWATWTLVTGVATCAAYKDQAYTSALLTGMITLVEAMILFVALRKGDFTYGWVDGLSQLISLAGVVAWLTTDSPAWAILFSIVADFFGAVPTFYHSWSHPHDESWAPFTVIGVGSTLSLAAVGEVGFVAAGFPAYLACLNYSLGLAIFMRQRLVRQQLAEFVVNE